MYTAKRTQYPFVLSPTFCEESWFSVLSRAFIQWVVNAISLFILTAAGDDLDPHSGTYIADALLMCVCGFLVTCGFPDAQILLFLGS